MSGPSFKLIFQPDPDIRIAAFRHEANIFELTYGVPYDVHVAEFAPYEAASMFLVVVDGNDEVRSTMRIVAPGPAGLKTLVDAAAPPWGLDTGAAATAAGIDPSRTWDIASLAAAPDLGADRIEVVAALYHGLTLAHTRNRVQSLLMTIDERVRGVLRHGFGLVTHALPGAGPRPFEGSPASTPVFAHCAELHATQRRVNAEAYRLVTQGIGFGSVHIPPTQQFTRRDDARLFRAPEHPVPAGHAIPEPRFAVAG